MALSDADRKAMAVRIILEHTTDVEYLSIAEMTDDEFCGTADETDYRAIDELIRTAAIAITWQ